MAQQINLYSPILLTPKRYLSAAAMLQAGVMLAVGMAGFAIWVESVTARMRHDNAVATVAYQSDKQRLTKELSRRPATKDTSALEQELVQARKQLVEKRLILDELVPIDPSPDSGRAALLRALEQTVPEVAWLTEVRLDEGRLELAGITLQPEVLRPWLERLSGEPALAGQVLRTVKVERNEGLPSGVEAWSFRVVSGRSVGIGAEAP